MTEEKNTGGLLFSDLTLGTATDVVLYIVYVC